VTDRSLANGAPLQQWSYVGAPISSFPSSRRATARTRCARARAAMSST
jgi:hypothetical protein